MSPDRGEVPPATGSPRLTDHSQPDAVSERVQLNWAVIQDFRANGGKATTGRFVGTPLLLLTTTGAKSGRQRVTPLAYTRDGGRYIVIASNGGADHHPAWYYNVVAQPVVTVEVGLGQFQARPRLAEGAERERLYSAQAALMPNFAKHALATTRQIPVVVLERLA